MSLRCVELFEDFENFKKGEKVFVETETAIQLLKQKKGDIVEDVIKDPQENLLKLHPISARELCKIKPPHDWIIDGLQRPGEIEMDYSEAGGLKSILALYRALCVANGLPFFKLKTKKCPVVICDNENSIPLLASRLNRIITGMNLKRKKFSLNFLIRDGQLDFGDFADNIREYVIANKVGLVIIDTARRFHSKDENSSQEMNDLYRILAGLVEGTTASLLLLHHTNKQNEYRGSTDLKGMLDVQVKIQKINGTTRFKFINEKNRWGEVPEVDGEAVFDDENGMGPITFIETPEETMQAEQDAYQKFNMTRGYVIKEIKRLCSMDGLTFKRGDITGALDGFNADVVKINPKNIISTRTIDRVLNYLANHKYIEKTEKKGVYLRKFSEKPHLTVWEMQFEVGNKQN